MSLNIGLDIDGVLADFDAHWRAKYVEWFGVAVAPEHDGAWHATVDGTHFADDDAFWEWTDAVPGFWSTIPAIRGALGGVYRLEREQGHRLSIITSRHEKTRGQTLEWLQRVWPNGPTLPTIHHTLKSTKGSIDVQAYVDDNPVVLESLAAKPVVVCFDQPWNRDCKVGTRVRGWDGLVRFFHLLEHPEDADVELEPVAVDPKAKAEAK